MSGITNDSPRSKKRVVLLSLAVLTVLVVGVTAYVSYFRPSQSPVQNLPPLSASISDPPSPTTEYQPGFFTVNFLPIARGGQSPYSYTWDFGDGIKEIVDGRQVLHNFPREGIYVVTLTVKDAIGQTASDSHVIKLYPAFVIVAGWAWAEIDANTVTTPTKILFSSQVNGISAEATIEGSGVNFSALYTVTLRNGVDYSITLTYSSGTHTCQDSLALKSLSPVHNFNISC